MTTAVVFIGGDAPHPGVVARLPQDRFVIAADSGLDHALSLGVHVHLLVGDLDSVSARALAAGEAAGVVVERHPPAKDATDTELALDAARRNGATHVVVVSGIGDRLDHGLAALLGLAGPDLADLHVEAWWGTAHVDVLHGPGSVSIDGAAGTLVSLVPVHGPAGGLQTRGMEYPLAREPLAAGTSRGISNVVTEPPAAVSASTGTVLVITPYALGGPHP